MNAPAPEPGRRLPRDIDALVSPSLKHVRDRWWDARFTAFLEETLQPRTGKRVLDVGCGTGLAAVYPGFHVSGVDLHGVDIVESRVREARAAALDHGVGASFLAADARALPYRAASFDAVFAVAVLQHLRTPAVAVRELARVVKPGGRVLTVEPDNTARHWYSSCPSGGAAREAAHAFFEALGVDLDEDVEPAIGPRMPELCHACGLEPLTVRVFPVSITRLGAPATPLWESRHRAAAELVRRAVSAEARARGETFLRALDRYQHAAHEAGAGFVELQTTLLFATVAQRPA